MRAKSWRKDKEQREKLLPEIANGRDKISEINLGYKQDQRRYATSLSVDDYIMSLTLVASPC